MSRLRFWTRVGLAAAAAGLAAMALRREGRDGEPHFPRERSDVGIVPVLALAALCGGLGVAAVFVMQIRLVLERRAEAERAGLPLVRVPLPPEPRLQADPADELAQLRRRERAELGAWEWADRKAGAARVPIERAMDELAARGGRRP